MGRRRGTTLPVATLTAGLVVALSGCSFPQPDKAEVGRVVSALPGVISVDASYEPPNLGGSSDQELEITVASQPDPQQFGDLVQRLPQELEKVENGSAYDVVIIKADGVDPVSSRPAPSTFTFLTEPVPVGLASPWATAVASSPPSGISLRVESQGRPTSVSLSAHAPVSSTLSWALASSLAGLEWSVGQYQNSTQPYVRFDPSTPIAARMVEDWEAIEATYAGVQGGESIARTVVVEDVPGVRRVRLSVSLPEVEGPLVASVHGERLWPIVTAVDDATPEGQAMDLELIHTEGREPGPTPSVDLVDDGKGAADWEAAYRQRFPDAVPVNATPK